MNCYICFFYSYIIILEAPVKTTVEIPTVITATPYTPTVTTGT